MASSRREWFVGAVVIAASSACGHAPADGGAPTTPAASPAAEPTQDAPASTPSADAQAPAGPASAEPSPAADKDAEPVVDDLTRAQIGIAEVEGLALKNAATIFLAQRGKCALDVAALVQGGFIANARPDPWGGEYRLECGADGESMAVLSNGPDGRAGTADDVRVE